MARIPNFELMKTIDKTDETWSKLMTNTYLTDQNPTIDRFDK